MSRLIVKNLPNKIKEERLRKIFGEQGEITDCNLKFTKSGQFRKFAFIGYKTENAAQAALSQFNQTFIDASKIQIEIARDFGDVNKPRAWSKYSKESSASQKAALEKSKKEEEKSDKKSKKKEKKKSKDENGVVSGLLGELKDDASFQEFLDVHQNMGTKPVWSNDGVKLKQSGNVKKVQLFDDSDENEDDNDGEIKPSFHKGDLLKREAKTKLAEFFCLNIKKVLLFDDTSSDGNDVVSDNEMKLTENKDTGEGEEEGNTVSQPTALSDLDYLKTKVGNRAFLDDSSESTDDDDDDNDNDKMKKQKKKKKAKQEKKKKGKTKDESPEPPKEDKAFAVYMMKMKGLPSSASEKSVKEFFHPIDTVMIKIPRNPKKKPTGVAFVGFGSEKDLDQAYGRNKNFLGGKRIFLKKTQTELTTEEVKEDVPRPWELKQQEDDDEQEGIAETGRLFVRNLPYSCTEEDLEEKFKKFGPLTEVNLPIDNFTKKLKGFAFITYMIPEHAVKAFSELDGKIFQGRMLHILPGKEKKEPIEEATDGSSFKKQKKAKQKALAASSHNWNTLFLGANAVADVLAEKYGAEKSKILDTDIRGSLGVRMALGETQVVTETRKFLVENGVSLDSFSQPNTDRSKTVLLVKNLPAGTTAEELQEIFCKHGTLGRVLLPPSGVTAIVEYVTPTEARAGFMKLAYTKFKNVPLYLEWAPMEVFKETPVVEREDQSVTPGNTEDKSVTADNTDTVVVKQEDVKEPRKKVEKAQIAEEEMETNEDESLPGSTLFVKNLNFDTSEESLRQEFSKCSKVKTATIAKKKDLKNPGSMLSMGYGFVEFVSPEGAKKALKQLQHTTLDGHQLELKISNRTTLQPKTADRKKQKVVEQKTTKILVRNIPFEAKGHEVEELFKVFGELKSVRLPKKLGGTGSHRGFGFVDFLTRQDAKRAFEALCHSTHLYGRRLVLEWAEVAEDIEDVRKRTAEHFHDDGGRKKLTKSGLKDHLEMTQDD